MTVTSPNIHQRMLKIMATMPNIPKNGEVKSKGVIQYKYVKHEDLTQAILTGLVANGVMMNTSIRSIERENISREEWDSYDKIKKMKYINKIHLLVDIEFVNADNPTDKIQVCYAGEGIDNQDKGIGKALTYAIKYAMMKQFQINTGEELDNEKDQIEFTPQETEVHAEIHQIKQLVAILNSIDQKTKETYLARMKTNLKVSSINDLTAEQATKMADVIREETSMLYGGIKIPA